MEGEFRNVISGLSLLVLYSAPSMHTIIIAILLYFWLNSAVMSLYVTSLLSAPVNKHNLDVTNYSEGIFQLV